MLFEDYLVNSGMCVFRRKLVKQVSEGWQTMKQAGDYWFWCEIIRQGNIFSCGKCLCFFQKHNEEVSAKFLYTATHFEENLKVLDQMYNRKSIAFFDMKAYFTQQRIALETRKSGMGKGKYLLDKNYWETKAKERGIVISFLYIKWIAFIMKGKHFFKT